MAKKQVLIFDSGVGGLSVFDELMQQTTNIDCFYLFDNAYFPYGELADDFLINRLTGLLLSFVEKQNIDLIIIACNSASTVALQALRKHLSIPVVGVVPAIKPAAQLTENGVIGLLATPATIQRSYTSELIYKFAAQKEVLKIGSTELVKLAEEKLQGHVVDKKRLHQVLEPWLALAEKPDTLVLGCTHFPLLKNEIASLFEDEVQLVDSGKAVAQRAFQLLGEPNNTACVSQHRAYYTQQSSGRLSALQESFTAYGFQSFEHYAH